MPIFRVRRSPRGIVVEKRQPLTFERWNDAVEVCRHRTDEEFRRVRARCGANGHRYARTPLSATAQMCVLCCAWRDDAEPAP